MDETKRRFVQAALALPAVLALPACGREETRSARIAGTFFSPAEYRFIEAATARLIPGDENDPGAIEAAIPLFIDLQLAGPYGRADRWYMEGPWAAGTEQQGYQLRQTPAELYRIAIAGIEEYCRGRYGGRVFADLSAEQQDEVLRDLDAPSQRSVVHATFRLERQYPASPARVFRALSDREAKDRWFGGGAGYTMLERTMDVRPGGRERARGRWASGMVSTFDAVYFDVVPDTRLVYAYEMHLDTRKISVSVATIELRAKDGGTHLVMTEQGAYLDGYDDAGSRERGTQHLLDALGASLAD